MSEWFLAPDRAAWLPIARQVLAGEFDEADGSTRESIRIGLRGIVRPDCRAAVERMDKPRPKKRRKK